MSDRKACRAAACTARPGERTVRGIVAIVIAAFAVALAPGTPLIGTAVGAMAIGIGAMAATGFCPADWLRARTEKRTAHNTSEYADARKVITLDITVSKEHSS